MFLLCGLVIFVEVMSDVRGFLCKKRNHHDDEGDLSHIKALSLDILRLNSPDMLCWFPIIQRIVY